MKKEIDVFEYASEIMSGVKQGVLLTTKSGEKVNTMTISWGMMGIEWNKPIFITFVRESRFTHEMLEKNGEFTVNIPHGSDASEVLQLCGTKSGRDMDKIKESGLTLVQPSKVSVPAIKELPLTLECRVVYKQAQDCDAIPEKFRQAFYPENVDSSLCGANRDYHTAYYGQIVASYLIEE